MQGRAKRIVSTLGLALLVLAGSVGGGFLFQATVAPQAAVAQAPGVALPDPPPSFAALANEVQNRSSPLARGPTRAALSQWGRTCRRICLRPRWPEGLLRQGWRSFSVARDLRWYADVHAGR